MSALLILRSLAALAAVLALLAGGLWIARRKGLVVMPGARRPERRLEIIERLSLDPKRQLLLVRRDDAELLILLTPDSAQPLAAEAPPRNPSALDTAALKARWSAFAAKQSDSVGAGLLN